MAPFFSRMFLASMIMLSSPPMVSALMPITAPPFSLSSSLSAFSSPSSPMQGAQAENQKLITVTEFSLNNSLLTGLPSKSMPWKAGNFSDESSSTRMSLSSMLPSVIIIPSPPMTMPPPAVTTPLSSATSEPAVTSSFGMSLSISSSSRRMVSMSC